MKRKPAKRSQAKSKAIVRRQAPQPISLSETIERVLITGDLKPLTSEERVTYYNGVCKSLGLNPLTRPFDYVEYQGKLQLYARKDCTEQLRKIYGISVVRLEREILNGLVVYTAQVQDKFGRIDTATGAVGIEGKSGLELANAYMKAETKAKRRATLSLCGLGMLDESELDAVGDYGTLTENGRIMRELPGSKTAQEEVAQRRIAEKKASIEELDRLKAKAEAASQPKPQDPNKVLYWKRHSETIFHLWGYTAEIQPFLNSKEIMGAHTDDDRWILDKGAMTLIKEWCIKEGHVLTEWKPPAEKKPEPGVPASEPIPVTPGPAKIEKVEKGTSKNGEFRKVFWKGDWHSTWDKKLFPYLDKAVGKGAEFLTVKKGNYSNIVSAKWIGETEFDEEGQPVIQRGPTKQSLFDENPRQEREPGQEG